MLAADMAASDGAQVTSVREARLPGAPEPTDPTISGAPPGGWPKRAFTALGLLALLASALFGGNAYGVRERFLGSETPKPTPSAVSRAADTSTAATVEPKQTVLRSQPWWQGVTKLEGVGPMTTPTFTIDDDAVQWRAKWTCAAGQLVVRAPSRPRPLIDGRCPGTDVGYGIKTGSTSLEVTAEGPWQLQIQQQVDIPLSEPPLPAMTAPGATAVAAGSFYRIDQVGTGTVTLYRLADDTFALRLDNFFVTANSDLEIQLSPLDAPTSTEQFTKAPRSASISSLDVTTGSLNFAVPDGVNPNQYKSVVIWCERLFSAYAAATLRPV